MHSNNVIVWFEIPVSDMERAQLFYEAILGTRLSAQECPATGMSMRVFDLPDAQVKGALMPSGEGVEPGQASLVYLNAGPDLAGPLSRVEAAGGAVVIAKTRLPDEFGFFAHILDSEGNRVGLHSMA